MDTLVVLTKLYHVINKPEGMPAADHALLAGHASIQ